MIATQDEEDEDPSMTGHSSKDLVALANYVKKTGRKNKLQERIIKTLQTSSSDAGLKSVLKTSPSSNTGRYGSVKVRGRAFKRKYVPVIHHPND